MRENWLINYFTLGRLLPMVVAIGLLAGGTGCQTTPGSATERRALMESIHNEPPGNYFVGRRYYTENYKFWGYVRKPRQPWTTAQMVVLNEQRRFAPDREAGTLGSDDNFEYRLYGYFSGDTVYEPASNDFYPEFVLEDYQLITERPFHIYGEGVRRSPGSRTVYRPR